ncbi:hypothetical protein CK203_086501 [Vitis vinifera]|uniref:Uncharacterized protein n=1 Tax=Vitis vinifera TaxID=29760 RepID=A0A438EI95_VITVI|nr:hypothetical protein CK203_086501 [Vitis vinifera]
MGESTRQPAETHMGTGGSKWEEEGRSTAGKGSYVGAVGRTLEWRGGQKAENAPGRTHGKNKTLVGYSWSQSPLQSDSKRQRAESAGQSRLEGPKLSLEPILLVSPAYGLKLKWAGRRKPMGKARFSWWAKRRETIKTGSRRAFFTVLTSLQRGRRSRATRILKINRGLCDEARFKEAVECSASIKL